MTRSESAKDKAYRWRQLQALASICYNISYNRPDSAFPVETLCIVKEIRPKETKFKYTGYGQIVKEFESGSNLAKKVDKRWFYEAKFTNLKKQNCENVRKKEILPLSNKKKKQRNDEIGKIKYDYDLQSLSSSDTELTPSLNVEVKIDDNDSVEKIYFNSDIVEEENEDQHVKLKPVMTQLNEKAHNNDVPSSHTKFFKLEDEHVENLDSTHTVAQTISNLCNSQENASNKREPKKRSKVKAKKVAKVLNTTRPIENKQKEEPVIHSQEKSSTDEIITCELTEECSTKDSQCKDSLVKKEKELEKTSEDDILYPPPMMVPEKATEAELNLCERLKKIDSVYKPRKRGRPKNEVKILTEKKSKSKKINKNEHWIKQGEVSRIQKLPLEICTICEKSIPLVNLASHLHMHEVKQKRSKNMKYCNSCHRFIDGDKYEEHKKKHVEEKTIGVTCEKCNQIATFSTADHCTTGTLLKCMINSFKTLTKERNT